MGRRNQQRRGLFSFGTQKPNVVPPPSAVQDLEHGGDEEGLAGGMARGASYGSSGEAGGQGMAVVAPPTSNSSSDYKVRRADMVREL